MIESVDQPLVSVITVVLNSAETLEECMQSVLTCRADIDRGDVEYVIIDGGSRDGSREIVAANEAQLAYWISEPDSGISDAFNKGIAQTRGKYVAILSADDFYEPGALSEVVSTIRDSRDEIGILHGSVRYIDPETSTTLIRSPDLSQIERFMSIYHPTMFVRRNLYDEIGTYSTDYNLAMDSEWVHRAINAGSTFHEMAQVITNVRLRGASHRDQLKALWEFRRSTISHFGRRIRADFYFLRQAAFQGLLKLRWFNQLWRSSGS